MLRIGAVAQLAVGLDLLDRGLAVVEEGLTQRRIAALADGVVEVALGLGQVVLRVDLAAWWLPGTQEVPADQAVVPPTCSVRSTSSTLAPSIAA